MMGGLSRDNNETQTIPSVWGRCAPDLFSLGIKLGTALRGFRLLLGTPLTGGMGIQTSRKASAQTQTQTQTQTQGEGYPGLLLVHKSEVGPPGGRTHGSGPLSVSPHAATSSSAGPPFLPTNEQKDRHGTPDDTGEF